MPRAGKYRRRVTVQQSTEGAPSASGETTLTWSKLADVWAEVSEIGSREVWRAQQANPEITTVVTIRYRTDVTITAAMRIKFGSRLLNLAGPPISDDRRKEWIMRCVEQS